MKNKNKFKRNKVADSFKIMMMGGPRTGKTSLLAGLFHEFLNGEAGKVIHASDISPEIDDSDNAEKSLAKSIEDSVKMLRRNCGKTILVDGSKTKTIWDYTLKITLPKSNNSMNLLFTDMNGEFYKNGGNMTAQIKDYVAGYDAIIITLETPCLMESMKPGNKLCPSYVNELFNRVDDIRAFLLSISKDEPKLVLFVPTKCEKWAKENRLYEVTDRVEEVFSGILGHLKAMRNVQVGIIPVQTIGNIVFEEHLPAQLLARGNRMYRCSPLPDGGYRLENGDVLSSFEAGYPDDDPNAVMLGSIMCPNAWFKIVDSEYCPKNCEQLAYHILTFMFKRALSAKTNAENSKISIKKMILIAALVAAGQWWALGAYFAYKYLSKQFGSIKFDEMQSLIYDIRCKGLMLESTDGIRIIQESQFTYKNK